MRFETSLPTEAKWFVQERKRKWERVNGSTVSFKEERKKGLVWNPRDDGKRQKRKETEKGRKAAHGCCVLLHFVLTWCMRLLGNSPYAPFIYNSAANAGHASPHPRSVIQLRSALLRSETLKQCLQRGYTAHAPSRARIFPPPPSSSHPFPFLSFLLITPAYFNLNFPSYPDPTSQSCFMHFSMVYNFTQYLDLHFSYYLLFLRLFSFFLVYWYSFGKLFQWHSLSKDEFIYKTFGKDTCLLLLYLGVYY